MKPVIIRDSQDLFQRDTVELIKQFLNVPLLNGQLLQDIALSGTTSNVSHSLNREPTGFIVIKKNAQQDVWMDATSTANKQSYLPLKAGGTVTVSLWVF